MVEANEREFKGDGPPVYNDLQDEDPLSVLGAINENKEYKHQEHKYLEHEYPEHKHQDSHSLTAELCAASHTIETIIGSGIETPMTDVSKLRELPRIY